MVYYYENNPKLVGTKIFDAIPQVGKCKINCNQCFFNHPGFYVDVSKNPHMPPIESVGDDGIVRVNTGNDSNVDREYVMERTKQYKNKFYNTSLPIFGFNSPFVFTANRKEEELPTMPTKVLPELMFVRLRVSPTNLDKIDIGVEAWTKLGVPVVLTFMRYYDEKPNISFFPWEYEWKIHILNGAWCATPNFIGDVMTRYNNNRLVSMCGSKNSSYCKDCLNCETYYRQAVKRMRKE